MSKVFKIPVTWEVYSHISIEADTLEEAIEIFDKKENSDEDYPLPTDSYYVDGSFKRELDIEMIQLINEL